MCTHTHAHTSIHNTIHLYINTQIHNTNTHIIYTLAPLSFVTLSHSDTWRLGNAGIVIGAVTLLLPGIVGGWEGRGGGKAKTAVG